MRALCVAVVLAIGASPSASGAAPDVVERFHAALIATMQENTGFADRVARLRDPVVSAFDVGTIARVSLGATWRGLDDAERERFVALLTDLVVSTYADRFVRFDGQRFETLAVESPRPDRAVVKTRLLRRTGNPVTLDYYLTGDRVYDIVADGVSDLSLRRADYAAIVEQKGYAGLVDEIGRIIAEHRRGADGA
jgi:phospholipid transport system substrate-binding protein